MSEYTFQTERYRDVAEELKVLLPLHWKELALYQDDISLDPDYDFYSRLDEIGGMAMFTVRKDGELRGYAVYFVRPHPHYKSAKWAVADIFWLHPEDRRGNIGHKLFGTVERGLAEIGVNVMHTTTKVHSPAAGFLLESMGHAMVEKGYSKRIG
ncbi:MAG TPA: GNAT family N-acetyltransferase [Terriglobales bacterium]|nr:GNAT family N-acetyltransferase [Terriglobales bacterium]